MSVERRPCILIADDDPFIREALTFLLRSEGYETQETANGVETFDALVLSPVPLLVLLDLVMPRMSGFDVLARIAKEEILAVRHCYIVLSAQPYAHAAQVGSHFAALLERLDIPFVAKPFDLDDLLRIVRTTYARLLPSEQPPHGEHTA